MCTRRSKEIRRAGGAFVRLPGRPSASAYLLPGETSTYSRSVLGARGTLEALTRRCKPSPTAKAAICGKFIFSQSPQA
jgi:hypothetical protein